MTALSRYITIGIIGIIAVYFYYFYYDFHGESKDYYIIYLFIISLLYGAYKIIQIVLNLSKISFKLYHIILLFFIQLFVLSCLMVAISTGNVTLGIIVFFKVSIFIVLVSILWLIMYALGKSILSLFNNVHIESNINIHLASLGLGFIVFMLGIFFLAAFNFYIPEGVISLLLISIAFSYKEYSKIYIKVLEPCVDYNIKKPSGAISLIIDELHLIIITLLLSVNFISVYRPFPIGWDDLGAYMNLPKILSESGELLALGQMYFWQLYTGIGFLFGSQTFAFYLNSFSGVILAVVVFYTLKNILGKKKTIFSIPLLGVTIILMLPMTVFQLAKDMKLDFGLLSISIIALSLMYGILYGEEKFSHKKSGGILFIVGLLIGVTFTIKILSLLLFLGILAMLFYKKLSLAGFLGFFGIIVSSFTYFNLWGRMNVIVPENIENIKGIFTLFILFLSGICFTVAYYKKHKGITPLRNLIAEISIITGSVILGFMVTLLPWTVKNIIEVKNGENVTLSVSSLLAGSRERYIPEYNKIQTREKGNENINLQRGLGNDGTTTNEDFGRYFGYEKGVNNYLKLPWNLSFQVNQKGEFTEISFIFLALLPIVFLFLPYKKEKYKYPVIIFLALLYLYYIPGLKIPTGGGNYIDIINPIGVSLTELFSRITLPLGYIIIFLFSFLPFAYFHTTLKRDNKLVKIFLVNYAFTCIYVFLWSISAFGIVWYGVVMYFSFILMISISLYIAHDSDRENGYKGIYASLGIVWAYIILSVIPHSITNLRAAGYIDYKLGQQTEEEALMSFHPEYFPILFELNISEKSQKRIFIQYRNDLLTILDKYSEFKPLMPNIQSLQNSSDLQRMFQYLMSIKMEAIVSSQIQKLQQSLYEEIIYPKKDNKNIKNIYRAGTFLKYFISGNNKRLLEDSLLNAFQKNIIGKDSQETLNNFKILDISYLLLDINAATIDQDPRKQLTWRYENMLTFVAESNIELVETDSICLRLALDDYKKNKNIEDYLKIAGVNYGTGREKYDKKIACIEKIYAISKDGKIGKNNYQYLERYKRLIESIPVTDNTEYYNNIFTAINSRLPNGYKVLFKIQ